MEEYNNNDWNCCAERGGSRTVRCLARGISLASIMRPVGEMSWKILIRGRCHGKLRRAERLRRPSIVRDDIATSLPQLLCADSCPLLVQFLYHVLTASRCYCHRHDDGGLTM